MARSGMGYEIGFAYTNFDNATMYPLILLILLLSIVDERRCCRIGRRCCSRGGASMMHGDAASRCATRSILIVGAAGRSGSSLIWSSATSRCARRGRRCASPASSMRDRHCSGCTCANTLQAFAVGARDRGRARPADRLCARPAPAVRRRDGADAGRALFDSEDHALSDPAARVRPRHVGQGRVRRDPRHHPGRAVHAQRRCAASGRSCIKTGRVLKLEPAGDGALDPVSRPRCRRSSPACASASR